MKGALPPHITILRAAPERLQRLSACSGVAKGGCQAVGRIATGIGGFDQRLLSPALVRSAGLIERFDKMMKLTRLDIKYSDKFTRDNWHRKIYIPVALQSYHKEKQSKQDYLYEYIHKRSAEILCTLGKARLAGEFVNVCLDLQDAREIAAAMMLASSELGNINVEKLGRIRCCTFILRPLPYLLQDMNRNANADTGGEERLLCINAALDIFTTYKVIVYITFQDFILFADQGIPSRINFSSNLKFGLDDEYLASIIKGRHKL
jgi:hypothetical protein